jgi:hypothetical protein
VTCSIDRVNVLIHLRYAVYRRVNASISTDLRGKVIICTRSKASKFQASTPCYNNTFNTLIWTQKFFLSIVQYVYKVPELISPVQDVTAVIVMQHM